MNTDEFIEWVQRLTGLPSREQAEEGAQIVLSLLSYRISDGQADEVARQLPERIRDLWESDPNRTFINKYLSVFRDQQLGYNDLSELYSLVDREARSRNLTVDAAGLVAAVFEVLRQQLTEDEANAVGAQLPSDIRRVWDSFSA